MNKIKCKWINKIDNKTKIILNNHKITTKVHKTYQIYNCNQIEVIKIRDLLVNIATLIAKIVQQDKHLIITKIDLITTKIKIQINKLKTYNKIIIKHFKIN